jgi:2-polyprenyl-3-methyl-5-hydroxy-6-metoxy-1,4-benzoquinol methylase
MLERCYANEIIDAPDMPAEVMRDVHRDLTRTHRWLGNTAAIISALRRDPLPVRRVLDIGCGDGGLLLQIRRKLNAEVFGVDLRPPSQGLHTVPIVQANAVSEALPSADVAVAVCVAHHLSDPDCMQMIRNVGRYCRRFIILDLVRHRLPLALFRLAVGPLIHPVNAHDGCRSIRRSYTPRELEAMVSQALDGARGRFRHSVAPLYMRQIVDITYDR